MKALNELIGTGQFTEARSRLRALAIRASGYAELAALCRAHQRLNARDTNPAATTVKVALLGTGTTDLIAPALALALETWDLRCEIHKADYNTYALEMLEAGSGTNLFKPDVAVVVNSPTTLPVRPSRDDGAEAVAVRAGEAADYWLRLCDALHAHAGCEIVLDNYHLSVPAPHGNLAAKLPWDLNNFIRRVNLELGSRAPSYLHLNDVDLLASQHGLDRWFDARFWYEAKLPVSLPCLWAYVRSQARIIAALYGRTAKCLVLDLDNTLWGGVVGDDGVDGIRIGQGDPSGEAFVAFQQYLLELRQRGVLLAVSSKNTEENARAPFDQRPEMILKRDDFVAFKANWGPKPESLKAIAHELNIGLDSLVFVDDNPREREIVRQQTPQVRVVELSDDPAEYVKLVAGTGWLEVVRVSDEDRRRTEQYRSNQLRSEAQASTGDYDAYLASLAQVGVIGPFEPRHLDRIAQLVNKTNQFNLTTRRQTRSEVEAEMNDPARVTAYVRLADRFGDNGLISVFSARQTADTLLVDQWLMSCRVLSRGVEHLLLNWVLDRARERGVRVVRGSYLPTAKNGLVARHYPSLGFQACEPDAGLPAGATSWELGVAGYAPLDVRIRCVDDY